MLRAGDCPSVEELERFVAQEVEVRESDSIDSHCRDCALCRARVLQISTNLGLLARLKLRSTDANVQRNLEIAGFEIVRELGRGGMGVVYEARQLLPSRRVALKVVRAGRISDVSTRALFQREIEALARLNHPHIAAVHAAGVTVDGDPYLAMELVEGLALDEFVRQRRPSLRERVELLVRLASAVHHAHQRSVVHRDLKPSNVLVEASGTPKVLDFGLAKILDDERQAGASQSFVGSVRGTLAYMSPEQARGDPGAIDARSDVYTLGVLLHELVAGRLPYDVADRDLLGVARVVCEAEPAPLGRLVRAARGDLEAIAARALRKSTEERYSSAAALAEDLQRWLGGEPVLAHKPSAGYLLAKLARRHRAWTLAVAGFIAFSLGFGVWMSVLYRRADLLRVSAEQAREDAQRQRQIADANLARVQEERDKAHWTLRFYARAFNEANTSFEREDLRVADVLASMERVFQSSAEGPVLLNASFAATMGRLHQSAGRRDLAESHVRAGLEALDRGGQGRIPDAATLHRDLAALLLAQHRLDEAEAELETARAILDEAGLDSPYTERVVLAIEVERGILAHKRGRLSDAVETLEAVVQGMRDVMALDEPLRRSAATWLVIALNDSGRYREALPRAREAFELETRLVGAEHRLAIRASANLAVSLFGAGEERAALEVAEEALSICTRSVSADDPDRLEIANVVAGMRWRLGEREACIPLFREISAAQTRRVGGNSYATLTTRSNLAKALCLSNQVDEAESIYRDVLARSEAAFGTEHGATLRARTGVARVCIAHKRFEEAEEELTRVWAGLEAQLGSHGQRFVEAAELYAALYESWEREADARFWRERAASIATERR